PPEPPFDGAPGGGVTPPRKAGPFPALGNPVTSPAPPFAAASPMGPPKFHDVTVRKKRRVERCVIAPVPPEEFGISRYARNIHDCGYCFHEVIRRESDMVEMGYDPQQVRQVNTYSALTNQEELARDTVEERMGTYGDGGLNRANRQIKIT